MYQEMEREDVIVAKWVERIVVKESPNFYMEAVELMDQFYQWNAENEDKEGQESSWWDRHLVSRPEYFTLTAAEVDELFKDVNIFVKECRMSAYQILSNRHEFQQYFSIKLPENSKGMPGFLKDVLAMSDVQSAKDLTRDEFVTCCLVCLYELSDKLNTGEYEIGSPEEREMYDKAASPDFDMKEVFDIVTGSPYSDKDQMTILRLFQDIDAVHERLRELLMQLEQICRDNFHIVKDRFNDKVQRLQTDEGKSYCNYWVERTKLQIDELRKDEPIYLEIGIISYGTLSMRFSSWYQFKLRLTAGLLFDDLSNLEDKGRFQDEMTQRQLKAI